MGTSSTPDSTSARSGAGVTCRQARELARGLLRRPAVAPERVADVETVVTELVSNADRHGGGVTGFRIARRPGGVLIEVSDSSSRLPREQPWAPSEPGGFGWLLINRLALTDIRHHRSGKTIMATIATATAC
ncbi:ATP-binding protein [Streptomyces sp. NPDC097619]|uniref:ATP-binding protein n=1 Tax=Streptomyces sp. NPDC097619 TaxID=3157228 RepID=UPI00331FA8BF